MCPSYRIRVNREIYAVIALAIPIPLMVLLRWLQNLYTDEKGIATFKGIPFMTSAGPCTSSIPKATIKWMQNEEAILPCPRIGILVPVFSMGVLVSFWALLRPSILGLDLHILLLHQHSVCRARDRGKWTVLRRESIEMAEGATFVRGSNRWYPSIRTDGFPYQPICKCTESWKPNDATVIPVLAFQF